MGNDWELYAEDEYGPDGSLIYTPPLLDKVWLDEEGLCKRCEQLLDQRRRVEHQTGIKKQAVPIPQTDDAPGPTPHHPIISEGTSVSNDDDNADDASSFDSPIQFEPEGDAWVDHGGSNNGPVLDYSAASAPPISSSSEKNVSWDDVVVDKLYSREGENTPHLCRNPKTELEEAQAASFDSFVCCAFIFSCASYGLLPYKKENEVSAAHGTMC
jgi:hypothetical protein